MDSKARITDELKPWFLSSVSLPKHPGAGDTLHFSKIMPNNITRSTDPDFAVQLFRERERSTGDVPGVQGGDVPLSESKEGAREEGGGGAGRPARTAPIHHITTKRALPCPFAPLQCNV